LREVDEILEFWFGPSGAAPDARSDLWWGEVDDQGAVDRRIEREFGDVVAAALNGELEEWRETPRTCLAYVLTLDQFPRHIHRGTARAFEGDDLAAAAARGAARRDDHAALSVPEQLFLSMPMMHAEDREVQRRSVEVFERIRDRAPRETREMAEQTLEHAVEHRDLIERFGRFPHRNPVLGREMTREEQEYLDETGNWYGQAPD